MSCTMYFIPYDSRLTTYGQWKMAAYWLEEYVWSPQGKGSSHSKAERGRHPPTDVGTGRPRVDGLLCRGKLWLEERTSEQLKGEESQ